MSSTPSSHPGTLAWARRTGGLLSATDKLRLLAQGTAALTRHPRDDLASRIVPYVHAEADAHPGGRFAFVRRWMRFPTLVRHTPWW